MKIWIDNNLIVSGESPELVEEFKKAVAVVDNDLSFSSILPVPAYPSFSGEQLEEMKAAWKDENWGVLQEPSATLNFESDLYLIYEFFTANAVPTRWVAKTSRKFPKLEFTLPYTTHTGGLFGVCRARDGVVVEKSIEW